MAGGVAALLTSVGVITRLAGHTGTNTKMIHYENCVITGSVIGNLLIIYRPEMNLSKVTPALWGIIIIITGLAMGMFVGCLAMSLAESLDVTSIFFRRLGMKKYLWMVILAVAIGKFIGNILFFFQ